MRNRWWIWLAAVLVLLLVGARLALPGAIENYVNRTLDGLDEYSGHVEDVQISLLRGQYSASGLVIEKEGLDLAEPFLAIDRVDIGIDWSALLQGEIVADVVLAAPRATFVDGPSDAESQAGLGPDWVETLEQLTPFRINTLVIYNGRLALHETDLVEGAAAYIDEIEVRARDFTNAADENDDLFATVVATGLVMGNSLATVAVRMDPLADPPELSVDADVKDVPLTDLNPLLEAYAGVDASAGTFSLFVEFASADGRFEGYAKPLIENAEILGPQEDGNLFDKTWEAVVALVTEVFENQPEEQIGAEIPLSGELTAVNAELVPAVFSVLRNAFVEALSAELGHTVELADVEAEPGD